MLIHVLKYLISDILVRALALISMPIYTYFLLPEEYGMYTLIISYVSIASILFSFNVHTAVGRYYYEKDTDKKRFLSSTITLTIILLFFSFSCLYFFVDSIPKYILTFNFNLYGIYFILLIITRIFFSIYMQTLIPQKKSKEFGLISMVQAYMTFVIVISLLYFSEASMLNMLIGVVTSELILSLYIWKNLFTDFHISFNKNHMKYILNYSFFLMPYALSGVIIAQIDRIMLTNFMSLHEVGIYSVSFALSIIPLLVFSAISNAWTPNYFKYMDNKEYTQLDHDAVLIMYVMSFLVITISLFSNEIINLLVNEQFYQAKDILPLLTISTFYAVLWQMWGRGIGYSRKTIWTSFVGLIAAISNFVLNYYLIPVIGLNGAVYSSLISYIIMAFTGYSISKHFLKIYTVPLKSFKYILLINLFLIILILFGSPLIIFGFKLLYVLTLIILLIKYKPFLIRKLNVILKSKA